MATAAPPAPAIEVVTGAIMFTDIAGFTEFTALRGDAEALELLGIQERIVTSAMPPSARIVKELGDGLMLWFEDAAEAVQTGLALQCQFEEESSGALMPLWVRIGIHWGTPVQRRGDLLGHDVNLTSRICNYATPGETVISEAALRAATGRLEGVSFDELGPVMMKGIPQAVPLYRAYRDDFAWPE
jgi:adenylate cyclase